jgi:hypothetical protein
MDHRFPLSLMVSLFSLSPLSSLLFLLSFTTPQNFTFLPPIVNSARIWRLGIARVATLAQCAFKIFALGGVSYIPPGFRGGGERRAREEERERHGEREHTAHSTHSHARWATGQLPSARCASTRRCQATSSEGEGPERPTKPCTKPPVPLPWVLFPPLSTLNAQCSMLNAGGAAPWQRRRNARSSWSTRSRPRRSR